MKEILNKKIHLIVTLIVSIIVIVMSMTISKERVFGENIQNIKFYHFILVTSAILTVIITYWIVEFVRRLIIGDIFYRKLAKHFLIYLGIMSIFLIIIWPGYWVWDEIWIIDAINNGMVYTWQSIITELFYAYSLLLIPSPVGITIIQTIIISLIIGFMQAKIEMKFKKKLYNIIAYILFLTPAILINNLYALRLSLYAYFLMLLITILIFDYWEHKELNKLKAIYMYLLNSIIMLWRSEGIIFLFIIPILIAIVYKNVRKLYIVGVMILINLITYVGYEKIVPSDSKYKTVIFINPLSVMLQQNLKGANLQEDLEKMDKVLDINLIKEDPNYLEISSYWNYQNTIFREDYKEHMSEFYEGFIDVVINNPLEFISARLKTFLASTGLDITYREKGAFTTYFSSQTNNKTEAITEFLDKYKIMQPINRELKVNVEMTLLGCNNITMIRPIFWNVIPILIAVFILMIERIIHKDYIIVLVSLVIFVKTVIVFLTAPASYFMYYFPEYIVGLNIIILSIYKSIKERNKCKLLQKANK